MSIDFEAVRSAYRNPRRDVSFRGVPTREEQLAEAERELVRLCRAHGGDPVAERLGEYGSLIGGAGKPLRLLIGNSRPLEEYARPLLAPLCWYDNASGHATSGLHDPDHTRLRLAIASYMAGTPDESRPTADQLFESLIAADPDEMERFWLHSVIACASVRELRDIMFHEGLSRHDVVRAVHAAGAVRHDLATWLNQFAMQPKEVHT